MSGVVANLPPDTIAWLQTKALTMHMRPSSLLDRIVQEYINKERKPK
jgi:hypothetical protein